MMTQAAEHHLQYGSAVQTKEHYELDYRKAAPGFLPRRLGIGLLILFAVSQLRGGPVDDLDGPSLQRSARGEPLSGCLSDGTQSGPHVCLGQTLACLHISRVVLVDRNLALQAQKSLHLAHHFAARRAGFKHLPDEALKSEAQTEASLATVWALLLLREQLSGDEVADLLLKLGQSILAQALKASAPQGC